MFAALSNGWELAKESYRVLMLDKELLVFPLLSGIACLLVLGSFGLPLVSSGYIQTLMEDETAYENPLVYIIVFAFYFVNYFVITFFNAALVACAIIRFNGGDPTLKDGFRASMSRLPQIFGWALVSATVGLILKLIESRSEKAGRFVADLLGMAWSAASYFVIPVLVVEEVSPLTALKRSFAILRETWGEALVANFGIGLIIGLAGLLAVVPAGLGIASGSVAMMAVGIGVAALWLILLALVSTALKAIVIGALYQYAASDSPPEQFDPGLLRSAFVSR